MEAKKQSILQKRLLQELSKAKHPRRQAQISLYRLASEPRRLWWRYLVLAPAFLILAAGQMLGLKRYPARQ